jgi:anti-sigma regulatory factor (Ser/Thr protein kinase)
LPSARRKARIENLGALAEVAIGLASRQGFSEGRLREIELAMEEALVNIFHYAYPEGQSGEAEVRSGITEEGHLFVEIMDQGSPFDVQSAPAPDFNSPFSDRPVGGLGIHLIRTLADHMTYLRKADTNILTLVFKKSR